MRIECIKRLLRKSYLLQINNSVPGKIGLPKSHPSYAPPQAEFVYSCSIDEEQIYVWSKDTRVYVSSGGMPDIVIVDPCFCTVELKAVGDHVRNQNISSHIVADIDRTIRNKNMLFLSVFDDNCYTKILKGRSRASSCLKRILPANVSKDTWCSVEKFVPLPSGSLLEEGASLVISAIRDYLNRVYVWGFRSDCDFETVPELQYLINKNNVIIRNF